MSALRVMSLAGLLLLTPALAAAEGAPDQSAPARLNTSDANQGPDQMGATGWSGPHRGQTSPGNPDVAAPTPSADTQPPVATGVDLTGPPKAFPSNMAPE